MLLARRRRAGQHPQRPDGVARCAGDRADDDQRVGVGGSHRHVARLRPAGRRRCPSSADRGGGHDPGRLDRGHRAPARGGLRVRGAYTPPVAGSHSVCAFLFGASTNTGTSASSTSFSVGPAPPPPPPRRRARTLADRARRDRHRPAPDALRRADAQGPHVPRRAHAHPPRGLQRRHRLPARPAHEAHPRGAGQGPARRLAVPQPAQRPQAELPADAAARLRQPAAASSR